MWRYDIQRDEKWEYVESMYIPFNYSFNQSISISREKVI